MVEAQRPRMPRSAPLVWSELLLISMQGSKRDKREQARMSIQQQLLIEQRVTNESKSPFVAYLLAILLWGFGAHRLYLGRYMSGFLMLLLWGMGWLTAPILIGWLPIALVCIWATVDLFLIPAMIREDQAVLRQRLTAESFGTR